MRFGEKVRQLRRAKGLTLRGLAAKVQVGFTYLSKVENERLDFADYPSDDLIGRLAKALDADEDELLLLAKKIPAQIKKRVLERPEAFRKLAGLDDDALDRVLEAVEGPPASPSRKARTASK
jgi:HTH-type transcriptional regulator, competence development regulator